MNRREESHLWVKDSYDQSNNGGIKSDMET